MSSTLTLLILLAAGHISAQEAEKHEAEQLTRDDVGPYRPELFPDLRKVEQMIAAGANQFRSEQKLQPLELNKQLSKVATAFAEFMAAKDLYGHHADGKSPPERVRAGEYDYCLVAENIGYQFHGRGFETSDLAKKLLQGWKNSPPHRKNLLDMDVLENGVGVAQSKTTGLFYAVHLFGRPKSAATHFSISNQTSSTVGYQIGEREFSLPGRYTRQHTACRAEAIKLIATDEAEAVKPIAQEPVMPVSGDEFVVDVEGDGLSIERQAVSRQK